MSSARLHIPDGHKVVVDEFIIGAIDDKGEELPVTFNGHRVKVHKSGWPIRALPDTEFEEMMRAYIASRLDSRIVIPEGNRVIVDGYIIGVVSRDGTYLPVTLNDIGIKVHVTGDPHEGLDPMTFVRMMRDALRRG